MRNKNYYKYIGCFISCLLLLIAGWPQLWAQENKTKIEYSEFFSEYQNFYLFRPEFIKKTFWGLATLKNPKTTTKKIVEKKVFRCYQSDLNSSCYYDQFLNDQKISQIPKIIIVPVVFSKISAQNLGNKRNRIYLSWEPESFNSPILDTSLFLRKANLAENSRYYNINPAIKKIKFNLVFPKTLSFVLDRKSTKSLIEVGKICKQRKCAQVKSGLYKNIPDDYQDKLYFSYKETDYSFSESIISINMHLKAVKVKLNHQIYKIYN